MQSGMRASAVYVSVGAKQQHAGVGQTTTRPAMRRADRSKLANQSHQFTLDVDLVRAEDSRLIVGVGRLERDGSTLLAQALEGGFLLFHEGHDNVAVLGRLAALADDD